MTTIEDIPLDAELEAPFDPHEAVTKRERRPVLPPAEPRDCPASFMLLVGLWLGTALAVFAWWLAR